MGGKKRNKLGENKGEEGAACARNSHLIRNAITGS